MSKVLGLDLGTNSIGWALIEDENHKILGTGVRIFTEGVNNMGEGDNEISKNASRTDARGARRQHFRRRLRKKLLIKTLVKYRMCPLTDEDINEWNITGIFPQHKLRNWFSENPYKLRFIALQEKISLEQLGRVLYHLIQRRGFQSNSRSASKDDGAIYKGDIKEGKVGITETLEKIENNTLGVYLYSIIPKEKEPFQFINERARNRYTTRQMYINEFEAIWEKQREFYPELTQELKNLLGGRKKDGNDHDGILFFQRPLRSQKHLVGKCTFEPKKTKCPSSAIAFELFICHQFINTIDCNGEKLNAEERGKILNVLLSKEKPFFKELRSAINKLEHYFKFNYKDDDKIVGTHTISNLASKKFFGQKWFSFSDKEREDIWHVLYFFEDKDQLKHYALEKWGFDDERAERICKFHLNDKYANLSRKAILNILPFLELGLTYDKAVALGGIKNAFGYKWDNLTDEQKDLIITNVPEIIESKSKSGFVPHLKAFLNSEFNLSEKELSKLYHHSAEIKPLDSINQLPKGKEADKEIQNIRNPIVSQALFELRKVVNALIDKYGSIDEIKIELARDLKISKSLRNQIRKDQKKQEAENDRIKEELVKLNQVISHDNMLLYKLWEECQHICPYTGREISLTQLFSGEVQIEHIIPWSKSLNDSFINKTLCFADENRAKGDKTPYEYYSNMGKEKWEEVKNRSLSIFHDTKEFPNRYRKFKQFITEKLDSEFINSQLNDTRYISREAKQYLARICKNVMVAPGQMTANLRYKWGLNNILNTDGDEKTRDDHRHHAIDALVMACSKISYLQELARWNRYRRGPDLKDFPMPWVGFREEAENSINNILVSHKKNENLVTTRYYKIKKNGIIFKNKGIAARGQLHKETVYGKRIIPNAAEPTFHIRKKLEELSTIKQINKIADMTIKNIILKRIDDLGGPEGKDRDQVPKNTFYLIDEQGNKIPQIFLPNSNGEPVPVKKVRIAEFIGNAEQLKADINQFVNPRNNHHILIYKDRHGNLKESVVTFWTAVERKKQGQAIVQLPAEDSDGEIITTMQINDMFLLGFKEENIYLENINPLILKNKIYRIQKLSSKFYEFRLINESTLLRNNFPYNVSIRSLGVGTNGWLTFNPIKIKISPIGILRPC